MAEKWIKRTCPISEEEVARLSAQHHVSPLVIEIASERGVTDFAAYFGKGTMHDSSLLKDMGKAVTLIKDALDNGKKIRIMGDYDCDGIMSTHILRTGLKRLAKRESLISWDIPDRKKDGYGMSIRMVEEAYQDGVDLILTCDNGISAFTSIGQVKEYGMAVVVTDHHQVARDETGEDLLPKADAIVNPHQEKDNYPYKDLCGATVAYKLMRELYPKFGFSKETADLEFLGYAAFATITDVMPLTKENRAIVKRGLPLVRSNAGLNTLCQKLNISEKELTAMDIGFSLGPCGNAPGRVGDIHVVMNLLESRNKAEQEKLAEELIATNQIRKDMCAKAEKEADFLARAAISHGDKVLCLYLPWVDEGIVGIVAGRIQNTYARPVFVFTDTKDGTLKGSGRSIAEYNMFAHLSEAKNFLLRFGGHPMASGLGVKDDEALSTLREFLNAHSGLSEEDLQKKVYYDAEISLSDVSVSMIKELKALEPLGHGNEAPLFFVREQEVDISFLGADKQTVSMASSSAEDVKLMAFRAGDKILDEVYRKYNLPDKDRLFVEAEKVTVSAVGSLSVNEYKGNMSAQMLAESYFVHKKKKA